MHYPPHMPKIIDIETAGRLLCERNSKTVVHCHGVFDLVHIGHVRHFKEAKTLGDILIVTLTPDEYVNKGPHRPVFSAELRAESLAALEFVDYVAINKWPTAVEAIQIIRPDIYVKGSEYRQISNDKTGKIRDEEDAVIGCGGRIHFTDDIVFSSSNLLNEFFSPFPDSVRGYLRDLSRRHSIDDILSYIESAPAIRVLTIGETILDEYVFCDTLGKSGKEPILAARHVESEVYAGGILAIANNMSVFTPNVAMLSSLGTVETREEFVRNSLDASIKAHFIVEEGPTIVKRRYVEQYPLQKLFEVYHMNGCEGTPEGRAAFLLNLERILPEVDMVVVADYGHGLIDREAAEYLCKHAPLLAVNAQVNAGNFGFNTISKYPRADFICISEKELRLEARSRNGDLHKLVKEASERHACPNLLITKGKEGSLCYSRTEGFFEIPAFTSKIVDRIGSGDTVLTVASLCVAQQAPMEVVGFLGNVAGAIAVGTICNKSSLDKVAMMKSIIAMLK